MKNIITAGGGVRPAKGNNFPMAFCGKTKTLGSSKIMPLVLGAALLFAFTYFVLALPAVTFISPTLSDNSTTGANWVFVNLSSSEPLNQSLLEWGNASGFTNVSMANSSLTNLTWFVNMTNLADGACNYTVFAQNASGDWNRTGRRFVTVDTTFPSEPTLISPANNTNSTTNTPSLNWTTVAETNFKNYTVQVDDLPTFASPNYIYNTTSITESNYTITSAWNDGKWYWRVIAYDNASNSNTSGYFAYTADTSAPTITLDAPRNGSVMRSGTWINLTVADLTGVNASWWSNNTGAANTSLAAPWDINTSGWSEGDKTIDVWANDTFGFLRRSTYAFRIDDTAPFIGFVSPTPDNGSSTTNNWVYVNTTISDSGSPNNLTALIDWNRSLVGWWRFNREAGENDTFARDWSSYGNNGTLISMNPGIDNCTGNCSGWTSSGKFGNGMQFDGVNDYVAVGQSSSLNITNAITIEAWVKPISLTTYSSFAYALSSGYYGYYMRMDTLGKISFAKANNSGTLEEKSSNTGVVSLNNWQHIVISKNDTTINFFKNGVNVGSGTFTTADIRPPISSLLIGKYSGVVTFFNGTIDEVRIFNRALSPEEINASFNAGIYQLYHNFANLTNGIHTYTAYAQDLAGNVNQTETRTLTVDKFITVQSPLNTTYYRKWLWANVSLDTAGSWCGVSLNGTANQTLSNTSTTAWYLNLSVPQEGSNNANFYCNNTAGNMWTSSPIYFTIDTTPPLITIQHPINMTYARKWMWVNVSLNKEGSWCGVSLNGTTTQSLTNSTGKWWLNLSVPSEGLNNVTVYCNDTAGNMNSTGITFTVNTVPPFRRMIYVSDWGGILDSTADIDQIVDNVSYMNGDAIMMIVWSDYFEAVRNESRSSWDTRASWNMLEYAINKSHEKNIKLYVWIPINYVNSVNRAEDRLFGTSYRAIVRNATNESDYYPDTYRNDLAFQQIFDYELGLLSFIAKNYTDLDGIHIEEPVYITQSYSTAMRNRIIAKYGYDTVDRSAAEVKDVIDSEAAVVMNDFFAELRTAINTNKSNPNLLLSANKYGYTYAPIEGFDPSYMSKNGLLDWYAGQIYRNVTSVFQSDVTSFSNFITEIPIVPIVGITWTSIYPNTNIAFLEEVQNAYTFGADMVGVFTYYYINNVTNGTIAKEGLHGIDAIEPFVSIILPQNTTYSTTTLNLSYVVSDTNLDTVWYFYNSQNITLSGNTTFTALDNQQSVLVLFANDTAGNKNASAARYFTVDSAAPTVSITTPTAGQVLKVGSDGFIWINGTVYDNLGMGGANVSLNVTNFAIWSFSGANNTAFALRNNTAIADGYFAINVGYADAAGNAGNATRNFTVDTTAPAVTIDKPANNAILSYVPYLNGTVAETNLANIKTNDTRFATLYSSSPFNFTNTSALPEGTYAINISANDTAGNVGWANVTFTYDVTKPKITVQSPLNQTYGNNSIWFNITLDETGSWVGYSLDNSANISMANTTGKWRAQNTSMADGTHSVVFYANDSAGNINSSNITFTIDTNYPQISFISPTESNSTYFSRSWIYANISLTETNFQNITFYLYNSTNLLNATTFTNSTREINWTSLAEGIYYFNATAFDSAGNSNSSETRKITLDATAPAISLSISPSSIYQTQSITITCSASDAYLSATALTVTKPGGSQVSASCNQHFADTSQAGTYTATYTATDAAGNSASTSQSFTVNQLGGSSSKSSAAAESKTQIIAASSEAVEKIIVNLNAQISGASVTIARMESVPQNIPSLILSAAEYPYQYLNITKSNFNNSNIENATIDFAVNKSWLAQNNITTIWLARYENGWNKLKTELINGTGEQNIYRAYTDGFSYFAIVGEKHIIKQPDSPIESVVEQPAKIDIEKNASLPERYLLFVFITSCVLIALLLLLCFNKRVKKLFKI